MAQPSVSAFFLTRKRGIEDDVISSQKKKVICLDRPKSSSESQESQPDSDGFGTVIVFPKTLDYLSSNDDEPTTKMVRNQTMRQGITPQRTTRSKKVHMQEVDGIDAPKIVNFWKGGNLSPQKKAKLSKAEATITSEPEMLTPVKIVDAAASKSSDVVKKVALIPSNGMQIHEIKKKLKGSGRLAELKTSLNSLQGKLDKLDRMESKRIASGPLKERREPSTEVLKSLKPFKSIEFEILR